jgi:hypothetical protein
MNYDFKLATVVFHFSDFFGEKGSLSILYQEELSVPMLLKVIDHKALWNVL